MIKMTNKDVDQYVAKMRKFTKELANQPKTASLELLINAGICDKKGNLKRLFSKK